VASLYTIPPSLPPGLREGHGFEPLPNARVRQRDQGEARMRPRYRSVPDQCTITWRFTQAEFDVFDEWFENTIIVGSTDFDLQVADRATALGKTWFTARFLGDYERSDASGLRYRVSANLLLVDELGAVRVAPGIEASGGIVFSGGVSFDPPLLTPEGGITFGGSVDFGLPALMAGGGIEFGGGTEMEGGVSGGRVTEGTDARITEGSDNRVPE
jgi:hypothetical protein